MGGGYYSSYTSYTPSCREIMLGSSFFRYTIKQQDLQMRVSVNVLSECGTQPSHKGWSDMYGRALKYP